jgi:hypothetical protein
MALTKEDIDVMSQIQVYIDDYNNEVYNYRKNKIVANVYGLLIQCPSLLSRFPKLRDIIQFKIIEFHQLEFYGTVLSLDLKMTLNQLNHILATLHTRSDYVI